MADLKDKQIRLVGSQSFAYATGSNYTQGHVHFTTDEHGSIVVNGKVYGTTDAAYVYVGSENIPTYVATYGVNLRNRSYEYTDYAFNLSYAYTDARINALDGKPLTGNGKFTTYVKQENGNITVYNNTLQTLVTVDNSEAKAYAPKDTNEKVKFIKSFEIEGDTIIPKYDYFANNLPTIPNITVTDTNYNGYYLPEFSASGHTITVTNGTQVTSYDDFKELKSVVDRFFGDAELDTEEVKSYIDTLAEIQEAFKNSYAEGIANSIKTIEYHGNNNVKEYQLWITYTTNGNPTVKQTAYVNIPHTTDTTYGLVKYDDITIKKNTNGQLYVDGALTDTKYTISGAAFGPATDNGAYVNLNENGAVLNTLAIKGAGIAKVTYSSDNQFVITVPETVVNYDHHSTGTGAKRGDIVAYIDGRTSGNVITHVNLSSDGKLTFSYADIVHGINLASFVDVTYGSNTSTTYTAIPGTSMELKVPSIKVNKCGHVVDLKENTVRVSFAHGHDEFVWL